MDTDQKIQHKTKERSRNRTITDQRRKSNELYCKTPSNSAYLFPLSEKEIKKANLFRLLFLITSFLSSKKKKKTI